MGTPAKTLTTLLPILQPRLEHLPHTHTRSLPAWSGDPAGVGQSIATPLASPQPPGPAPTSPQVAGSGSWSTSVGLKKKAPHLRSEKHNSPAEEQHSSQTIERGSYNPTPPPPLHPILSDETVQVAAAPQASLHLGAARCLWRTDQYSWKDTDWWYWDGLALICAEPLTSKGHFRGRLYRDARKRQ
ncbi:hypothetical protein PG985_011476 [Apiospora marii]|uniref:uncharacterized protein n=1 Tax=Apiospora marii TaxID=335849 RepID=UPI00312F1559